MIGIAASLIVLGIANIAQDTETPKRVYAAIPWRDLKLEGEPPDYSQISWRNWERMRAMAPRVLLDGPGSACMEWPDGAGNPADIAIAMKNARLALNLPAPGTVTGQLILPQPDFEGMVRIRFETTVERSDAKAKEVIEQAWMQQRAGLLDLGVVGSAWFRYHLVSSWIPELVHSICTFTPDPLPPPPLGWREPRKTTSIVDSFSLASAERSLLERFPLHRLVLQDDEDGPPVRLKSLAAIEQPLLDRKVLAADRNPPPSRLAQFLPADQPALLFPSFADLVMFLDESESLDLELLANGYRHGRDVHTRQRYENQLCLQLDEAARTFGGAAIGSVALTASDLDLRAGSDVAVLLEATALEPLRAFLLARHNHALETEPGAELVGGNIRAAPVRGVVTPDRRVSAYLAVVGNTILVSNSRKQIEKLGDVATGKTDGLASTGEFRFFRTRYPNNSSQLAFAVVPNRALERWVTPRSRLLASRRLRAAAYLSNETASTLQLRLHHGNTGSDAWGDWSSKNMMGAPALGETWLTTRGMRSERFGTLSFQTPIAELEADRWMSGTEHRYYEQWRAAFLEHVEPFYRPAAARIGLDPDRDELQVDVSIAGLDLDALDIDWRDLVGTNGLTQTANEPSPNALVHLALALDPESTVLDELGAKLTPVWPELGSDPLAWLGESLAVFVEDGVWANGILGLRPTDGPDLQDLDWWSLPAVLRVDVRDTERLAAFLNGVRSGLDRLAPGYWNWTTHELAGANQGYVELAAGEPETGSSIFYATTPTSWIVSPNEEALLRALHREAEQRTSAGEPAASAEKPERVGASLTLDVDARGADFLLLPWKRELLYALQVASWKSLPILNEWRRIAPDQDPVAFHAQYWHELPRCPGGGDYVWNATWQTMESTVFGHPGEPRSEFERWPFLKELRELRLAVDLDEHGAEVQLRIRR